MKAVVAMLVFEFTTQCVARIYLSLFLKNREKNRTTSALGFQRRVKYFLKAIFFSPLLVFVLLIEGFLTLLVPAEKDAPDFDYFWNAFFAALVFSFGYVCAGWLFVEACETPFDAGMSSVFFLALLWLVVTIIISKKTRGQKVIFDP
jgi:uncharacterized BrkB/YihY/UPF0761 family membrane protein